MGIDGGFQVSAGVSVEFQSWRSEWGSKIRLCGPQPREIPEKLLDVLAQKECHDEERVKQDRVLGSPKLRRQKEGDLVVRIN